MAKIDVGGLRYRGRRVVGRKYGRLRAYVGGLYRATWAGGAPRRGEGGGNGGKCEDLKRDGGGGNGCNIIILIYVARPFRVPSPGELN